MSHWINGRYYSSTAEYQAALQRQALERANALASQLEREAEHYRQRVYATEQALRRAEDNYEEQLELNRQLGEDLAALQRHQNLLQRVQEEMRAESERQFRHLHDDLAQTKAEQDDLKRRHEEHKRQVGEQFCRLDKKLHDGLAQAEKRRRQTEDRLQEAVRRVDQKVENDRAERLRAARSQLERADLQIEAVASLLEKQRARSDVLNLTEDVEAVEEHLAVARRLRQQGDAAASLSASEIAFAAVRSLGHKAARRQAQMNAARNRIQDTTRHLAEILRDKVIRRYFASEVVIAESLLKQLKQRAENGYGQYAKLEIERDKDERLLTTLEREILLMAREAPLVQAMYKEREQRILHLLDQLVPACDAPMSAPPKRDFADPEDRKSDRIIRCDFGGVGLELMVPLDPTQGYTIHGFVGMNPNEACAALAERVVARLEAIGQPPSGCRVDHASLNRPMERPRMTERENLARRLQDLART